MKHSSANICHDIGFVLNIYLSLYWCQFTFIHSINQTFVGSAHTW